MPIHGSFAKVVGDRKKNFHVLIKETAKDGLGVYQDSIKHFTPVKTGRLKKSIKKTKYISRKGKYTYWGRISTGVYYAKWVEYGTAPHLITPKSRRALAFHGAIVDEVKHPGSEGRHMFQLGTRLFADVRLEPIMRKNLAIFLASGAKGLRSS